MKRSETSETARREGRALSHQAGHVGEVAVPERGDEVVHQPELRRLSVDVGRYEEKARLGTQHRVGRQQVLAGAALWTQHGGRAGGEAGQQGAEEERAEQRGDDVHGCSAAETRRQVTLEGQRRLDRNGGNA